MSLSRWKLMAGVLGVSIGGLAAAASQCPKFDKSKGRSAETPVAKADTKVPPAGPASPAAPPMTPTAPTTGPALPPAPELPSIPPPSVGPAVPAPPSLAPAGATPPLPSPSTEAPKATPPAPPAPGTGGLPAIPADIGPAPTETKPAKPADVTPPALPPLPGTPMATKPESKPSEPPKNSVIPAPYTPPVADLLPPGSSQEKMLPKPSVIGIGATQPTDPGKPVASPPAPPSAGGTAPPSGLPSTPPAPPTNMNDNLPPPPPSDLVKAPPTIGTVAVETKFRILLRVGEGEPTFEVKNGDNLVLKVACEKVDIKSPEKGGGLSEVTAKGKVRFAGFGAEGTCDELKFLAGTGEVSMTGEVKVQVKDKLGRIESELTTGSMKYKIDSSAVGGAIKP